MIDSINLETPARPYNDGSYEVVQDCRRNPYFLKFQGVSPRKHIQDLLNHYRKPFKFIEKYSDFRLLGLLSDEIKEIKDGVLFDMEKEVVKKKGGKMKINEYFGKIENLNEKKILEVKKTKENVKAKNTKNKKNKSGNKKGQIKATKEKDFKRAETKNLEKELTNTSSISANQEEISTNNTKKISNDSVIEKILEKSESADLKSDLTPTPSLTKSESSEVSKESENLNKPKIESSKNSKQKKKNKNKDKTKSKEPKLDKGKQKSKEPDPDMILINEYIKENLEIQAKKEKEDKEKEARFKNELKNAKQKFEKLDKVEQIFNNPISNQNSKENPFEQSLNYLLFYGNIISEKMDNFFSEEKTFNEFCWLDQKIKLYLKQIIACFDDLFKIQKLENKLWGCFDSSFYSQFIERGNLIANKYPNLFNDINGLNSYVVKFVKFYGGNDLVYLVRKDLVKALSFVLNSNLYKLIDNIYILGRYAYLFDQIQRMYDLYGEGLLIYSAVAGVIYDDMLVF
uniref:Uncharacterized protein n=1 Tax=Meloidogyne floridensis TaxID=298350 RepID=A0A915PE50_9BILA